MGNEAIALGTLAAGVNVVCGYPGTPSTEVLETVAKCRAKGVYIEWSVNEKAAMELAAGAAYAGARTLVTMKQVGLNVASDPLMSLAYIGVKGGMVVMVADDPGPISSQTEQDTRHFASYAKLPCFDPSNVQEAYEMMEEAFALSEKEGTPVIFRPTTRVCHAYASILVKEEWQKHTAEGFRRDPSRWVIFPRLSTVNHAKIEGRNERLSQELSDYQRNYMVNGEMNTRKGIVSHGISFPYVQEAVKGHPAPRLLRIATPFPFPMELAERFLTGLEEVLVVEELSPVLERELIYVCGSCGIEVKILGKLTGHIAPSGENTRESVKAAVYDFMGWKLPPPAEILPEPPEIPVRPPVLCAGCPHRASFYAVKKAMKGQKAVFCGDIGCYTLGNAMPLDMVDTCLCMGAGLNIAQGLWHVEPDTKCFAFVGDSTFFASAITGVINAVYNRAELTVVVLDNSTTAMTGHQPHPGTGKTVMGDITQKISIERVLEGIGVPVEVVNPLELTASVETVKRMAALPGVKAIVFRSPCIALMKPDKPYRVLEDRCRTCRRCITEIGCPAITILNGKASISQAQCIGCRLCRQICPFDAIVKEDAP